MDVLGTGARERFLGYAAARAGRSTNRSAGPRTRCCRRPRDPGSATALEDARDAGRLRLGGRCGATGAVEQHVPSSGATTPAMILISVDLPALFSPSTAWMRLAGLEMRLGAPGRRRSASRPPIRNSGRGSEPAPAAAHFTFASVRPMISRAVKLMRRSGVADEEVVVLRRVEVGPLLHVRELGLAGSLTDCGTTPERRSPS
jgi:hypothetical protein